MKFVALLFIFQLTFCATSNCFALERGGEAKAFLLGAINARKQIPRGRVVFRVNKEISGKASRSYLLRVTFADERTRFEQMISGDLAMITMLFQDSVLRHHAGSMSIQTNTRMGAESWGMEAFDPRAFGVAEMISPLISLEDCFWKHGDSECKLVGTEKLRSGVAHIIEFQRGDARFQFWIDEPLFRIHKVELKSEANFVELLSEFEDETSVYPSKVVSKRGSPSGIETCVAIVDTADFTTNVGDESFTIASLAPKLNTMVIDQATEKVVGYWDGEGISASPVVVLNAGEVVVPFASSSRYFWFGLNGIVALILLGVWRYMVLHSV